MDSLLYTVYLASPQPLTAEVLRDLICRAFAWHVRRDGLEAEDETGPKAGELNAIALQGLIATYRDVLRAAGARCIWVQDQAVWQTWHLHALAGYRVSCPDERDDSEAVPEWPEEALPLDSEYPAPLVAELAGMAGLDAGRTTRASMEAYRRELETKGETP